MRVEKMTKTKKTELEKTIPLREDLIKVCKKYENQIGTALTIIGFVGFVIEMHYRLGFPKQKLLEIIEQVYPEE